MSLQVSHYLVTFASGHIMHLTAETEWLARCAACWRRTGDRVVSVKLVNTKPRLQKKGLSR